MSTAPFLLNLFVVSVFVCYLHWHYGNWKRHKISVTIITLVAWTLPFLIVFSLPIDVSVTIYNQCLVDSEKYDKVTTFHPDVISKVTNSTPYPTKPSVVLFNSKAFLKQNVIKNSTTTPYTTIIPPTQKTTTNSSTFPPTTSNTPIELLCVKPLFYIPTSSLSIFWHVVYWTSQCLTWVWLPMMQSYAKAGEFTFFGKLKYALFINGLYYGTYLIIFTCCLVYLAASARLTFNLGQLKVLAITASNTWGLTLLVLLLGYGLVELPRTLWMAANMPLKVKRLHFRVAKLTMEKIEAEEELEDVVAEVNRLSASVTSTNPLRKFVDVIVALSEDASEGGRHIDTQTHTQARAGFERMQEEDLNEKFLVKLHRRLIFAKQSQSSKGCQWKGVMNDALWCEDTLENMAAAFKSFHRSPAQGAYNGLFSYCYNATLEWYWRCRAYSILLKTLSVITVVFSVMVVWSECLFFIQSPVLSLFAIFVNLAKMASGYHAIELVSILTITYISVCTYFSIFKLKIFSYYTLVGPHESDQNSMIFCGMLLCRLTPPLCLNFLGLIHLDSHVTDIHDMEETSYTRFMGNLVVLPFISSGFNIYFPIAIVILCILTFFSMGTRVLHCLGFQQFIGDDEITQEMIDEGVELVKRERRRQMRGMEGMESRRREIVVPSKKIGNDRSELLNDAEPMGYRSYDEVVVVDRSTRSADTSADRRSNDNIEIMNNTTTVSIAGSNNQSSPAYLSNTFVRPNAGPPRNLFDDV